MDSLENACSRISEKQTESMFYTDDVTGRNVYMFKGIPENKVIHIPDDVDVVCSDLFWHIAYAAKRHGLEMMDIKVTGGAGIKYIYYDKDELDYWDRVYRSDLPELDMKIGFIQYTPVIMNGLSVIPDGKAFLVMLLETVYRIYVKDMVSGMTIRIKEKLVDEDITMFISSQCTNFHWSIITEGRTAGMILNKKMFSGLKEYKRRMDKIGWLKREDIDIQKTKDTIINRIRERGYTVTDISSTTEQNDDFTEYDYSGAPEIIRNALCTEGGAFVDCLYDSKYGDGMADLIGMEKAVTNRRLLCKALDLSYRKGYILGSIEVNGILTNEPITRFSICIDSRSTLRIGRLCNAVKKEDRTMIYLELEKFLNGRWRGVDGFLFEAKQ